MEDRTITTYAEAAARFGVVGNTITDLTRKLGITPKPVPWHKLAKGLDADDMALLEHALSPPVHCRCLPGGRRRDPAALPA